MTGDSPSASQSALHALEPAAEATRRLSPALLGIVVLCFLLPFLSVQCAGQTIISFSGFDLVLGSEVEVDPEFEEGLSDVTGGFGETEESATQEAADEVGPNIFVIGALLAALASVALALLFRSRSRHLALAITAGLVPLSLIGFWFDVNADTNEFEGVVEFKYGLGYWGSLLIGLAVSLAHLQRHRRPDAFNVVAPGAAPRPPPPPPPPL